MFSFHFRRKKETCERYLSLLLENLGLHGVDFNLLVYLLLQYSPALFDTFISTNVAVHLTSKFPHFYSKKARGIQTCQSARVCRPVDEAVVPQPRVITWCENEALQRGHVEGTPLTHQIASTGQLSCC